MNQASVIQQLAVGAWAVLSLAASANAERPDIVFVLCDDLGYGAYCGGAKPGMRCVKRGDWKLIRYESTQDGVSETQLFNLVENPDELLPEHHHPEVISLTGYAPNPKQTNLADDPAYSEKLKEMEQVSLEEMRNHFDPYRFSNQSNDGLPPVKELNPVNEKKKRSK